LNRKITATEFVSLCITDNLKIKTVEICSVFDRFD